MITNQFKSATQSATQSVTDATWSGESPININLRTYRDYPAEAKENAQTALNYADKNGWGDCGTPVGKARANQLARGEAISEETIARMASFERQRQNSTRKLGEGCGRLMWLAWGGDAGVEWATRKLKEIRRTEKFAEGMAHYTADGELYEGPTHKHNGRLMTGASHSEDSEYLYHKEELAKVGPRGAIVPSKKAPASSTPNKNPEGKGTSKGDSSTSRGSVVPAAVEETLQKKADDFNERYKKKLGYGVTVGQLKAVYQRGVGAFTSSSSPRVTSQQQWAYARVNAWLYIVKTGRPQNPKYVNDNDLLPGKHPKNGQTKKEEPKEKKLSVLFSEHFDEEKMALLHEEGHTIYIQSSSRIYNQSTNLSHKLRSSNLTEDNILYGDVAQLDKKYNFDLILTGEDTLLELLSVRGQNLNPKRILKSIPISSIEEAEIIEDIERNSTELKFVKVSFLYKYEEIPGIPAAESGSRTFCKRMLSNNRFYTLEEIRGLSNVHLEKMFANYGGLEPDVFLYRGGFYRQPGTLNTTPFCRHQWTLKIVMT